METMTETSTTFTNASVDDAFAMTDRVNDAFADGWKVTANGRKVKSWGPRPATTWMNGSMSVDVETRNGRTVTQVWVKAGQSMTFTFTR